MVIMLRMTSLSGEDRFAYIRSAFFMRIKCRLGLIHGGSGPRMLGGGGPCIGKFGPPGKCRTYVSKTAPIPFRCPQVTFDNTDYQGCSGAGTW